MWYCMSIVRIKSELVASAGEVLLVGSLTGHDYHPVWYVPRGSNSTIWLRNVVQ